MAEVMTLFRYFSSYGFNHTRGATVTRNLSVHGTKKIHEALLNVSVKRNPPSSQRHANLGELLVCIYFSTCNERSL